MDNFSRTQVVRKTVVPSAGGVVAAAHPRAAEIGAAVLEAGGDAVDAAVAVSFAIGVVEPWMSGPAGGGAMVLWRADERRAGVVDFGMRAPRALDPADYPLADGVPPNDMFPWPTVLDNRNVQGATAVAVPGVVSGMGVAHDRYGRLPWTDLVTPAVGLARTGLLVDWVSTLFTASAARSLAADPDAARMFLDDGTWPICGVWTATTDRHLDQSAVAATLERIAALGAREFYEGEVAHALVRDLRAKGSRICGADLADYRARFVAARTVRYRGGWVHATPGLTGGPTLARALAILGPELADVERPPGAESYVAYARALDRAYTERLAGMGDAQELAPTCTTHFSVVDRDGNMCSVTQTLLSIFGARVVSPSTGLLLNNGIMWFDPVPGRPNSLGPGKRCLGNFSPVIGETADGRRFALGASGGRKIIAAVLQIVSFLVDHGMSLEHAFHQPRIDVSGAGRITADRSLPQPVLDALVAVLPTVTTVRTNFPYSFACPSAVLRHDNANMGCTEIMSPWGDVALEQTPSHEF
ncbi:gamma-glutamyltransferase family protein [Dactylosporangium sp. CA-233914]|uniref:gamma-glutamyltransferase family protein n=1 Tax=Dactylosporangium sp. CA-233914 TaxID=3239934 RepID=UPI003D8E1B3C